MITQEFREWVKGIKTDVENCLKDLALVELKEYEIDKYPLIVCITVLSNELKTHMSFDQLEYNNNNEEQRRKLAEIRCHDVAWTIKCEIEELKKVVEILQK